MELLVFWILASIIIAAGAGARGRSGFGWFLLAVLISPFLSLLLLLLLPQIQIQSAAKPADAPKQRKNGKLGHTITRAYRTMRKCPYCAETILPKAVLCRFCGSQLSPAADPELIRRIANL
jgi:hypothetical protein